GLHHASDLGFGRSASGERVVVAAFDALHHVHQIYRTNGACPDGTSYMEANASIPPDGEYVCGPGLGTRSALEQLFLIACSSPDLAGVGY
ncbi:MAG: hypothetical protein AAFX99_36815, partial [Myxococcota bacterium]